MKNIIQKAMEAIKNKKYDLALGLLEAVVEMSDFEKTVSLYTKESERPSISQTGFKSTVSELSSSTANSAPTLPQTIEINGFDAPEELPRLKVTEASQTNGVPRKIKNIIPPGMASMMMAPDHPDFESKGSKETRRV